MVGCIIAYLSLAGYSQNTSTLSIGQMFYSLGALADHSPISRPINRPINKPINKPFTNQPTNQQTIQQPTNHSPIKHHNQLTKKDTTIHY
jgi:hypothetical protein